MGRRGRVIPIASLPVPEQARMIAKLRARGALTSPPATLRLRDEAGRALLWCGHLAADVVYDVDGYERDRDGHIVHDQDGAPKPVKLAVCPHCPEEP